MNRVLKFFQVVNALSIDIAIGATSSAFFFSVVFNQPTSILVLLSLGLSVWIIYTTDHLLDVRNPKAIVISSRHKFHQTNYHLLKWVLVAVVIIDLVLIAQLPIELIYAGIGLGSLAILYVAFNKRLGASKELIAAIFYTSGVCLPTLAFMEDPLLLNQRLLLTQFFVTALINLILFSLLDREEDKASKFTSIATIKSAKQVGFLLMLLLLVSLGLSLVQLQRKCPWQPISILFTIDFILGLLFTFRKSEFVKKYYRLIGDAVFLLPCAVIVN